MSTLGVILSVIYTIQVMALPAVIIGDAMMNNTEDKVIKSKKDVIYFLIPFRWVLVFLIYAWGWWKALK
jgi:hypothetical protein